VIAVGVVHVIDGVVLVVALNANVAAVLTPVPTLNTGSSFNPNWLAVNPVTNRRCLYWRHKSCL